MLLLHRFKSMPDSGLDPAAALSLRRGTIHDYHALARFHYRTTRPATIASILTICDHDEPVAVLIVSNPTLNAPWRPLAWPQLCTRDKRQCARIANQKIRTISRIIVDPRWRGLGLASRLVRTYLDNPLTPLTETLAAMAPSCPFFASAGMIPCPLPSARHNMRLRRALFAASVEPWQLLDPALQQRLTVDHPITRALRTWARATRAHRALADGPIPELARRAAAALSANRIAYIHGVSPSTRVPPPADTAASIPTSSRAAAGGALAKST